MSTARNDLDFATVVDCLAAPAPVTTVLGPSHRLSIDSAGAICTFSVGCHYYGSLLCGNSQYKVLCVRRTAKSVWMAHYVSPLTWRDGRTERGPSYELPRRSKIVWNGTQEVTHQGSWYVSANGHDDSDPPNSH